MIIDTCDRAHEYAAVHPVLGRALALVAGTSLHDLPVGRHEYDEDLFAIVNAYETQPLESTFWEAHDVFIDVQLVLDGIERIDWLPRSHTRVAKPYDPVRELVELAPHEDAHPLPLAMTPGRFAVFFPDDAHRPGIAWAQPAPVRKIVLKVRYRPQQRAS
jgi:biofilm protein TabA